MDEEMKREGEVIDLAVVGGGPAGLRVAEVAAGRGRGVVLFEGKASVGRKFLVAGKGGLNLTHGEDFERFAGRYEGVGAPEGFWRRVLEGFSPADMREWAAELGVETFQATSGRVYPKALKAAPLLRRWVGRLKERGVRLEMNHRLCGLEPGEPHRLVFENGRVVEAREVVLALGGGSWPQTGSDGKWVGLLERLGIGVAPLVSSNCGWEHGWSERVLAVAEGMPLKNLEVSAGGKRVAGELMVTRYGLEGGAIYQLGSVLRGMAELGIEVDFKPTFSVEELVAKFSNRGGDVLAGAGRAWKLAPAVVAILGEREWRDVRELAVAVKAFRIGLDGPRPIAEAISSAGGVRWSELDERLMLKRYPGVYVVGEMVDWDAPTGGYLMQGCFAMGKGWGVNAEKLRC
jgi:uncharacterized flavoprotein (TIGR03862 family)